ncbi:MAG TPA: sulfite exporter TauE/SafE family protein [Verrucomicrobiales bacterium]|nr:sulfite exporter TauE/SafE family protein [Verrucomicrobiales bacterium]
MSHVPSPSSPRRSVLGPFFLWLTAFYVVWLGIVIAGNHWGTIAQHWGIAVAMAAGSYFAGSTPMGGGTVGFPVLVLLFDGPATLGRDFSFAIQSIGMVSASVFIWCRRQPLEWTMLRFAMLGSLVGTPLGVLLIAPFVSQLFIKVLFAVVWASFGILHLLKTPEIAGYHGITPGAQRFDRLSGLMVGFFGGLLVSSITGVGVDMIIYAVLVLMCHADLKIAIPTSVILMAFTSLVGVATKFATASFEPGVYANWLAAAPVVALGAPFGALVVDKIGRKPTLYVVSVLCVLQLVWTLSKERTALGSIGITLTLLAVLVFLGGFAWLYRIGKRLARRQAS